MWRRRFVLTAALVGSALTESRAALAHHEALFGPQSSLAVESEGFVSMQAHPHAYGINGTETQETTFIMSAGISPIARVPWSLTLIQAYTYETTRAPTPPGSTGPFSACNDCLRHENNLVATAYRFDLTALQKKTGKDGNFALVSAAIEPPTGNKDYAPLTGPWNYIGAGLVAFEWSSFAAVGLGYYRSNTPDATQSKKGDNFLVGAGFAYTPIDTESSLLSLQIGSGFEYHLPDIDRASPVGGGWEVLASPTIVASPLKHARFFALVTLPIAQSYRADYQQDRWRAGVGVIYTFDREPVRVAPLSVPQ